MRTSQVTDGISSPHALLAESPACPKPFSDSTLPEWSRDLISRKKVADALAFVLPRLEAFKSDLADRFSRNAIATLSSRVSDRSITAMSDAEILIAAHSIRSFRQACGNVLEFQLVDAVPARAEHFAVAHLLCSLGQDFSDWLLLADEATVLEAISELRKPDVPATVPAVPKERLISVKIDYSVLAAKYRLPYFRLEADVLVGSDFDGIRSHRSLSEGQGYVSYPKLDTLLGMGLDLSKTEVYETRNSYAIVRINGNINKTVILSDLENHATYIFNGLVDIPKEFSGEFRLSEIDPLAHPQVGGRICFYGEEKVEEWKDRLLERITDPDWFSKEERRLDRLDAEDVVELTAAMTEEWLLNWAILGMPGSSLSEANVWKWGIFLSVWNLYIEKNGDIAAVEEEASTKWLSSELNLECLKDCLMEAKTKWASFLKKHPHFFSYRLPSLNSVCEMLGWVGNLTYHKGSSAVFPAYISALLITQTRDHAAHVVSYMSHGIKEQAQLKQSKGVRNFLAQLVGWSLPVPTFEDFSSNAWAHLYEANHQLPSNTVPWGLRNTTSLIVCLGGKAELRELENRDKLTQFVAQKIHALKNPD